MSIRRLVFVFAILATGVAAYFLKDHPFVTSRMNSFEEPGYGMPGRWREAPKPRGSHSEQIAQLEAIGYAGGYEPAGELIGVTLNAADQTFAGYNFYTSGHLQGAILMDMDGELLHEWEVEFDEVFPEHAGRQLEEEEGLRDRRERWRRAYLFPNGDVLGIYEGFGLVKIDANSNVLWRRVNNAHHALQVTDDGHIWILSRTAHVVDAVSSQPILEDFLLELDAQGNELRRLSVLDAVLDSDFSTMVSHGPTSGDIFHTNALQILDGTGSERAPFLAKGNILLSIPKLDSVVVVDGLKETTIWAMTGLWKFQHEPTILENGNMLVFDNNGHEGRSKVVEIDPATQAVAWAYRGTSSNGFHTQSCGANQRLPNGNTLITESDSGRAMEVTSEGKIVWEFYNPARAGDDNELIATLFEVLRLPADFPLSWVTD